MEVGYSWQFFLYEPNPAHNAELAEAALNDPENPYTIDEYIYADKTGILYDANALPSAASLLRGAPAFGGPLARLLARGRRA